ncbi:MAG: TetR family transcriptional regulator C-terminal domain-containing protein [Rhodobacteraceae bacterium]|nr:TetR family transcriptional regulator C-terminal domain-containing protein [Paracoccaceae bacterium]
MNLPKRPRTRIQARNREIILEAALDVFSTQGFRGATLDQIAAAAGLSKHNLLYYYDSKETMHAALLVRLLDTWLAPLRAMSPQGEPVAEILRYVGRKLEMAQEFPRESRLFANEILQGAPRMEGFIATELRALVEEKAALVARWIAEGRLAPVDPRHLIFSIWATTQHYADFDVQVRLVLGPGEDPFPAARRHLEALFRAALTPTGPTTDAVAPLAGGTGPG